MLTHQQAQRDHFTKRLRQRYGIRINTAEYLELVKRMHGRSPPSPVFVRRQSRRTTIHRMEVRGQEVLVVYDSRFKTLVTALPKEDE